MATYKLDIDVSNVVSKYKQAIADMKNAGAKESITKGLEQQLDALEKKFGELSASGKTGFNNSKEINSFVSQVQKAYNKLSVLGQRMSSETAKEGFLSEGKVGEINKSIKAIREEMKKLKTESRETMASFSFSDNQVKKIEAASNKLGALNDQMEKTRARLTEIQKKASDAFGEITTTSNEDILKATKNAFGGVNLANWSEDYQKKGAKSGQGKQVFLDLKNSLKDVIETSKSFDEVWEKIGIKVNDLFNPTKAAQIKSAIQAAYSVAQANIASAESALSSANAELAAFEKAATPDNINKVAKAMERYAEKAEQVKNEEQKLANAEQEDNKVKEQLQQTTNELSNATEVSATATRLQGEELRASAEAAEKAETEFDQLFDSLTRIFSITTIFNTFRKIIRDTFNDIKSLDQAYASIAYVTNETVEQLWSTYDEYSSMAEQLGQSTVDVIKASAIYRQQGLDTAEALELTTDTMKLATIAGNDYSKATQEMTAALRGFKMEMDEGAHVSDVYSELAAHAAASVDGIAQAMSRTASIANSAGMSFENTSAFLTQMIETTQESAENIGTSMKTIIARFTELKKNVAGTSESEFEDLSFNKVDDALRSVGVALKDAHGQFRNLDEVFLELSAKWDTLDRNTQRYIATIAAGSRQQSRFIAMMDNYERTAELIDIAQDSAGKAEEQFSKAADTISFKLNTLKTNWEEFRLSFTSSDFVKGLIDELGVAVNSLKDSNKVALAAAIPFAIIFVKGFLKQVKDSFQTNTGAISSLSEAIGKTITEGIKKRTEGLFSNQIRNEITRVKQELSNLQLEGMAVKGKGILTLISDEDKTKFEQVRTELVSLAQSTDGKFFTFGDKENAQTQILLNNLKDINLTTEEEQRLLEYINGKTLEEICTDTVRWGNELELNEEKTNGLEKELNKLTSTSSKFKMAIAEGAGSGVEQGLNTLANSLGLVATMALSGADAAQTMKVAFGSLAAQFINMAVSIIPKVITALNATGEAAAAANAAVASTGIGALVVGLGAVIALAIKLGIEAQKNKKTEEELHDIRMQNLQEQSNALKEKIKSEESEIKNAEQLIEKYDELSAKTVKTAEEQEEYNSLIEEIKDSFPEVVTMYDEAGEKVRVQRDYWERIVELQKESLNIDKQNQKLTNYLSANEKLVGLGSDYDKESQKYNIINNWLDNGLVTSALLDGIISEEQISKVLKENGITYDDFSKIIGVPVDESNINEVLEEISKNGKELEEIIKTAKDGKEQLEKNYLLDKDLYEYYKTSSLASYIQEENGLNTAQAQILAREIESKIDFTTTDNPAYNVVMADIDRMSKQITNEAERKIYQVAEKSKYNLGDNGLYTKGDYGYDNPILGADNLPEYKELSDELKAYLASMQITAKEWEEIRYNDEDWKDIASWLIPWIQVKAEADYAKALGQLNISDEDSKALNSGDLTETEIREIQDRIKQNNPNNDDFIESYIDSIIATTQESKDLLNDFGIAVENLTQNQIVSKADEVKALINAMGNAEQALKLTSEGGYDADKAASFFSQFSFEDVNALNNKQKRQEAVELIQEIFNQTEEEAEKTYDEFINYAKADINKLSSGDLADYEARMTKTEEALTKYGKTFSKVINGSGKLAASEISTFNNALEGINKDIGTNFKLSDFFDPKTNKFDRLGFKKALEQTVAEFEKFQEVAEQALEAEKNALTPEEYESRAQKIKDIAALIPGINYQIKVAVGELTEVKELLNQIENLTSAMSSAVSQYVSDGFVSSKTIDSLAEVMGTDFTDNLGAYINDEMQLNIDLLNKYVKGKIEEIRVKMIANEASEIELKQWQALSKEYDNAIKEQTKQVIDKEKELTDARKAHADALEDVAEKQKALNEAIQDYNNLLYGSENRKSSLDNLYNYQEAISYLSDELTRAKELLTDSKGYDEASKNLGRYLNAAHFQLVEYAAQNKVIEDGLAKRRDNLLNGGTSYEGINVRFGDYVKIDDRTGLAAIDQRLLQEARFADKWKDQLESFVEDYNKYSQELLKNEDAMRKAEKEILKLREEATKKWADFEKDIAEVLKEEYQKQVDDLKNMYDSMKDADDKYLDALQEAIEKQRRLREKQNKWEELAEKEKKLALLRRDTSGANQLETNKLEKEIQQDREQMLDDSIDSVIENMQQLNEKQEELRQAEVELKEALLDDALYWNLTAENVAQSFNSVDEFLAWSVQHHKEYLEMTAAQRQEFLDEQTNKFNEAMGAAAVIAEDAIHGIENQVRITADEVNTIVDTTGEAFTTEVDRIMRETSEEMSREIEAAQEKIKSATEALTDANEKLAEAARKIDEIANSINGIHGGGWSNLTPTQEESTPVLNPGGGNGEIYASYAVKDAIKSAGANGQNVKEALEGYDYSEELIRQAIKAAFTDYHYPLDGEAAGDAYFDGKRLLGKGKAVQPSQDIVDMYKDLGFFLASIGDEVFIYPSEEDRTNHISKVAQSYHGNIKIKRYKEGGLVKETGYAYVDGTDAKPEAFLNAEDTERIGNAAKLLSNIPSLNRSNISTTNTTYGDTKVEVNLYIGNISSDVDVDDMIDQVTDRIVKVARPLGTNVILQQQV